MRPVVDRQRAPVCSAEQIIGSLDRLELPANSRDGKYMVLLAGDDAQRSGYLSRQDQRPGGPELTESKAKEFRTTSAVEPPDGSTADAHARGDSSRRGPGFPIRIAERCLPAGSLTWIKELSRRDAILIGVEDNS